MKQIALDIALAPAPTLEGFAGRLNQEAVQFLAQWCAAGRQRSPVPVYLWGEAGSGKTHLLRAARHALQQQGEPCGWLDAASPADVPFEGGWRAALMDDVQLYATGQQHTAFNWFINAMTPADGQPPRAVLAAGSLPPTDLPLREDLRSRLGWGHVFQLHAPTEGECRALLQQAAAQRGLALGEGVTDYVLTRFSRDMGSLMRLLERLDRYSLQTRRAVTIPLIKAMLEEGA